MSEEEYPVKDMSTDSLWDQYATIEMRKGKSPEVAARITAKKHSGSRNMFAGGAGYIIHIDPAKLTDVLYEKLIKEVVQQLQYRERTHGGKEPWRALDSAMHIWSKPTKKLHKELKRRVIKSLVRNPFAGDPGWPYGKEAPVAPRTTAVVKPPAQRPSWADGPKRRTMGSGRSSRLAKAPWEK